MASIAASVKIPYSVSFNFIMIISIITITTLQYSTKIPVDNDTANKYPHGTGCRHGRPPVQVKRKLLVVFVVVVCFVAVVV